MSAQNVPKAKSLLGTVERYNSTIGRIRMTVRQDLAATNRIEVETRERQWTQNAQAAARAGETVEIQVPNPARTGDPVYLLLAPASEPPEPQEPSTGGGGSPGGGPGDTRVATTKNSKGNKSSAAMRARLPALKGEAASARAAASRPSPVAACTTCAYREPRCSGPAGTSAQEESGSNGRAIGCFDPGLQQLYLADLGPPPPPPEADGAPSLRPQGLPPFMPVATEGLRRRPPFTGDLLFGVSLSVLVEPEGYLHFTSPEALRRGLRLAPEARVALLGTAPDRILERFWGVSERRDVWRRIAGLGLEFATGMTFSVWEGFPRFDQIFNQERNLRTCDLLAAEGVPSVPFLFWGDEGDRRHLLSWLRERKEVRVVGALAQFRQRAAFDGFLTEVLRFEEDLGRKLHFLLVGAATAWKLELAFHRLGSVTVATTQPIMKAIRGLETQPDLSHAKGPWQVSREELAARNVERYRQTCARLAGLSAAA